MSRKTLQMLIVSAAVIAVSLVGCNNPFGSDGRGGGGSEDGPSATDVRYSGTLLTSADGQMQSSGVRALESDTPDADTVVAVPINRDGRFRYDRTNLENAVTADIQSDGSFELELSTDDDWVIMLLDSTAQSAMDRIVAFLGLEDEEGNVLLRIPTATAEDDINAGDGIVVDFDSATASFAGSMGENQLSLGKSLEDLQEMARTDNLIRAVANIYVNYEKPYEIVPLLGHTWNIHADDTKDSYSNPADYTYVGLITDFDYRHPNIPFDYEALKTFVEEDGQGSLSEEITIIPPSEVTTDNGTIPAEGIANEGEAETGIWDRESKTYWAEWSPDGGSFLHVHYEQDFNGRIGIDPVQHPIPDGYWEIEVNGAPVSFVDLGGSSPILSNGEAAVYVPSVRLQTDSQGTVERIRLEWQVYNAATDSYEPIASPEEFASTISYLGMTVDSHDPDERFESVNIDEDDYDATSFDLEKSWKFFDPDYNHEQSEEQDFEIIREIRIGYRLYGFDFGVNIRADH